MRKVGRLLFGTKQRAFIVALAILVLSSAGVGLWILSQPDPPFSAAIKQSVQFPLYYPSKLPKHFSADKASFSSNGQVVIYKLKGPGSASIGITIQAKPQNYDFDSFYNTVLSNPQGVATQYGDAKVGMMGRSTVGVLVTDRSWVMVRYTDTHFQSLISDLMASLKQY